MKPDNWLPASGARMSWDAMQSESEPPVRVQQACSPAQLFEALKETHRHIESLYLQQGSGTAVQEGKTEALARARNIEAKLLSMAKPENAPGERSGVNNQRL